MKKLIRAEAIVPFLIILPLIYALPIHFAWWMWVLLFLAPDISMLGYLFGNRVGALSYNLFHHQLLAAAIAVIGFILHYNYIELAGLVLLGHSSIDRAMGYGLKFSTGFKFTHLGSMGGGELTNNEAV
ncbi:hypothetical protein ASE74_15145 [Pedobacter sp. Leaf216]|uniref:DUF4260 domain-containing protein n=1 Tax=Pedobacter sp. Leaf216 TaxID=1735684 RepID=UPI0006FD872D|nr:DUF4260 domain-containing protein [Pedobacter sp. Leaf216]KQM78046.1 hypothetical protein ASE74_15145 [Pedobacter sp. Leaf216]